MESIRAILVDDEESARDVLENLLLRFCPEVELVAKCNNLIAAVETIKREQPNLVFLDIEMPNYAGYEIVNFFQEINFEIVFVTAYDQYAIRAFEISAMDYLLKPIDIERLKAAVFKTKTKIGFNAYSQQLQVLSTTLKTKEIKNILVNEKGSQYLVAVDSIIAIEAQESYCIIHTTEKKYLVSKNLKHFETIFTGNISFIRVHKSWLISIKHILNYSKSNLTICLSNGIVTKLSKYKKAELEEALLSK